MATFQSLYEAAQVFAQHIDDSLSGAFAGTTVLVAPPREDPNNSTGELRLTLMWSTPQPTHRNDPWERGDSGYTPPPLTLSVFILVTAYGSTNQDEPIEALGLLSEVMRTVHSEPVLSLPLATLPGTGDGELSLVQVPTAADLMEKIYSPLNVRHRPWALYELGPVQLEHREDEGPAPFVVSPGGLRMDGPAAQPRPVLHRVTPQTVILGRTVRIDVTLQGRTMTALSVGGTTLDPATHATDLGTGDAFTVTIDPALTTGGQRLGLRVGDSTTDPPQLHADPGEVTIVPVPAATTDTPALDPFTTLTHPRTGALTLQGVGLTNVDRVLVWPDAGVAAPDEVIAVPFAPGGSPDLQLSLAAGALSGFSPGVYRFAARSPIGGGRSVWTPFVILELT